MRTSPLRFALIALTALAATPGVAQAGDVGQHPAVFSPRKLPGIEAANFIVGHPAQGGAQRSHANHEHPAVKAARRERVIDTNGYLVQPPATTQWTLGVAAAPSATLTA